VPEALVQLEQRKQALLIAVEQLERRQERIRTEMRTSFAGASQELAIRVQGLKTISLAAYRIWQQQQSNWN